MREDITLLGVIGNPISHSLSPLMHNHVLRQVGLQWQYLPFLLGSDQDLPGFLNWMRGSNLRGINVTVPYKEAVIPYLDQMDEVASALGAVNTIVNEAGQLKGYNTDAPGFIEGLDFDVTDKQVVILGAGGSAKAIAYALLNSAVGSLCIQNRQLERATQLKAQLHSQGICPDISVFELHTKAAYQALAKADLVVQCTSVGMDAKSNPLTQMDWVNPQQYIIDIIYSPLKTPFLAVAQSNGATIQNGLGMLAGQAAKAFEYFTNKTVGFQAFYQLLETHIKGKQ